jgi:hypothetical protein
MTPSSPRSLPRAIALAITALLLAGSASALASSGPVSGPRTVHPGRRVLYRLSGLMPSEPVVIVIQPRRYFGGNCCGTAVRGHWRTTPAGTATVRFRFPARYSYGCYAQGCAGRRAFARGSLAVVEFTVQPAGGSPVGTPVSMLNRTVTVRVR